MPVECGVLLYAIIFRHLFSSSGPRPMLRLTHVVVRQGQPVRDLW